MRNKKHYCEDCGKFLGDWKGNERTKLAHTDKFSDMISDNHGSLREDECFEEGWDTYESE